MAYSDITIIAGNAAKSAEFPEFPVPHSPIYDTAEPMKKTFPLKRPGVADARIVDAVKFELRKYLKRERRKKFPEGFDQWDFACKVGPEQGAAATKAVEEIFSALDAVAQSGSPQVYVEILATAGKRFPTASTQIPPESAA